MKDETLKAKILRCAKQKKGIKLKSPNDNLCSAYLKKANNSVKAMNLNRDANLRDWAVDAAYYARYHALYALLQKCGIECEIHDCSIMLLRFLFQEEVAVELLEEIETAKKQRIDLVYYTNRIVPDEDVSTNITAAPNFVLNIEGIISRLGNIDKTNELRNKLKKLL